MKFIVMLTAVVFILGISGCETMEGFGRDLQKVGDKIEKKADNSDE